LPLYYLLFYTSCLPNTLYTLKNTIILWKLINYSYVLRFQTWAQVTRQKPCPTSWAIWIWCRCPKMRRRMAGDRSMRIRKPFRPVFLCKGPRHRDFLLPKSLGYWGFSFSISTSNQYQPRTSIWYMPMDRPQDNHTIDCRSSLEIHQRPAGTIF